jgi:hypothetical protein
LDESPRERQDPERPDTSDESVVLPGTVPPIGGLVAGAAARMAGTGVPILPDDGTVVEHDDEHQAAEVEGRPPNAAAVRHPSNEEAVGEP